MEYETNGSVKIAIVDDEKEVRDLVSAYFRPKGYTIYSFATSEMALEELERTGDTWSVILTDFHFSNMDGGEFTILVHKIQPDLPVILITPPEATHHTIKAFESGVYDVHQKPINFVQLHQTVDRALKNKSSRPVCFGLRAHASLKNRTDIGIIGRSPKFLEAMNIAKKVASSSANIFISGESGTGKEVITRFIHAESRNCKGPLVAINCSAIPESLLESELFGHAKGSFTGAIEKKIGLFEAAENGTLFLDEIGDLSFALQAKLLRVLQEKTIKRVGENISRPVNCRIISATHKNLIKEVNDGRFREDLYFRLNVIPIALPPLRERREDILPLAEMFLKKYAKLNSSRADHFSAEAEKYILENPWRGNVRELENAVERAVVLSQGEELGLDCFTQMFGSSAFENSRPYNEDPSHTFKIEFDSTLPSLDDVVNQYLDFAVKKNEGARDRTAREIGIDRKTLYKRLKSDKMTM